MTWVAPRTWVTGETLTSTLLNVHVRDNLLTIGGAIGANYAPAAANTDLAQPTNWMHPLVPTAAGWSVRTIAAAPQAGQRLALRNTAAFPITILHAVAGGGVQLNLRGAANAILSQYDSIEFIYDGTTWNEINRDQSSLVKIFDVVVARGQAGDPSTGVATVDTNTILGGNIPQGFRDLIASMSMRVTGASAFYNGLLQMNNISTATYDYWNNSSGVAGATAAGGWYVHGAGATASNFADSKIEFADYVNANRPLQFFGESMLQAVDGSAGNMAGIIFNGKQRANAALIRIAWLAPAGNWADGSRFALWGRG